MGRNAVHRLGGLLGALEAYEPRRPVVSGLPFREAYRQAADPARWAEGDPGASLAARVSPGAAADLRLDALRARLRGE